MWCMRPYGKVGGRTMDEWATRRRVDECIVSDRKLGRGVRCVGRGTKIPIVNIIGNGNCNFKVYRLAGILLRGKVGTFTIARIASVPILGRVLDGRGSVLVVHSAYVRTRTGVVTRGKYVTAVNSSRTYEVVGRISGGLNMGAGYRLGVSANVNECKFVPDRVRRTVSYCGTDGLRFYKVCARFSDTFEGTRLAGTRLAVFGSYVDRVRGTNCRANITRYSGSPTLLGISKISVSTIHVNSTFANEIVAGDGAPLRELKDLRTRVVRVGAIPTKCSVNCGKLFGAGQRAGVTVIPVNRCSNFNLRGRHRATSFQFTLKTVGRCLGGRRVCVHVGNEVFRIVNRVKLSRATVSVASSSIGVNSITDISVSPLLIGPQVGEVCGWWGTTPEVWLPRHHHGFCSFGRFFCSFFGL